MNFKKMPDLEYLRSVLEYNPETGEFTWKENGKGLKKIGAIAGSLDCKGYRRIKIFDSEYKAHRLAYYMYFGIDPLNLHIDHINSIPSDNRICNLRLATQSQNCYNRKLAKNNSTGYKGIAVWSNAGSKYYRASVMKHRRSLTKNFPYTEDGLKQALEWRASKVNQLHGDFARFS